VLSFAIPFAVIPLVRATADKKLMGKHVNNQATTVVAWLVTGAIVLLNVFLIVLTI
jgi:manganese transport protein